MTKDDLIEEARRIERAFCEADELKQRAARDVTAFAAMVGEWFPDATQREIAELRELLYWDTTLPYRDWPKALGLKKSTGGVWSKGANLSTRVFEFQCRGCGDWYDQEVFSRTQRDTGVGVCPDCEAERAERSAERSEEWQREREARERYVEELRAMPYREYLKTEHWQTMRSKVLKAARYRCAVCNASGTILDVHHRTYERRGCEYHSDLIVLCRDCHARFHGKVQP